jgi:shikimate kinase
MKNIFLVGMPSSGKSTVGKALAVLLQYEYIDLDSKIEECEGKPIPKIFSENGETYFREVESRLLKDLAPYSGIVVATGGGVPCFFDNMAFIKKNGISVFLDIPVKELINRIQLHGVEDRPLIAKMKELEKELRDKLDWRRPYYSQADLTIEGATDADYLYKKILPLLN